ncbi:hypothetical protein GBAR_LOCUS25003 [Geodia barretti]|uniref:Uncharacterized protein n=1 Tax=Geodia barretti TaxID=519541 RepID=A0AA35TDW0_GEOBA|nr:hypothetical protein GBAR_LOCUS25003 [Geodia barretti]
MHSASCCTVCCTKAYRSIVKASLYIFYSTLGIICTALSSYSQGIQDGWLACPSLHLLAKSTNNLGHPILSLHSPATVKVFRMVG